LARAQDDLARALVQVRHGRAGRRGARAGPGSRQRAGIEWSSPRGARANRQRRAVRSRPGARGRMKRDNQFSVVICAYTEQRWDDLLAAVDSVRRQTLTPREIIVVVDHNPAMLARVRDEIGDVLAVENHQRQGLSGARNSGLRASSGEYVAFLDDDALAEPDWLGRLAAGYDDPRVVGVGGVIEPLWSGGRPGWFPAEYDWVVGCTYVGMPTRRMAVRRSEARR